MNKTKAVIFDLDGTLYDFDGDGTFGGSSVGIQLKDRYNEYLQKIETLKEYTYEDIVRLEKQKYIPPSQIIADMAGETREKVLDDTWGRMMPENIIIPKGDVKEFLSSIATKTEFCFLLTGAPKVWADKVLKYLGISEYFCVIYTAENYKWNKWEIFSRILQERNLNPSDCVSVGDQFLSDIAPAMDLWMRTLHITQKRPLLELLKKI